MDPLSEPDEAMPVPPVLVLATAPKILHTHPPTLCITTANFVLCSLEGAGMNVPHPLMPFTHQWLALIRDQLASDHS